LFRGNPNPSPAKKDQRQATCSWLLPNEKPFPAFFIWQNEQPRLGKEFSPRRKINEDCGQKGNHLLLNPVCKVKGIQVSGCGVRVEV